MNLDLLKKLTRLANNNPNDNEANFAARRVCKMLEECDFKLVENSQPSNPQPNFKHYANPFDNSWIYDLFINYEKIRSKDYKYSTYNPFNGPVYKSPPIKEKRILKCVKCGSVKETLFVGHPDVYECNNCQWTAYTKGKVK